jgi:hypothetical protein
MHPFFVQGRPGAPRFVTNSPSSLTFEWNAGIVTDRLGAAEGFELQVQRTLNVGFIVCNRNPSNNSVRLVL